jgi:hypothetical protein
VRRATPGAAPKARASTVTSAKLEDHRQHGERDHQRPARRHDGEVELHADGDEEEAEEDVVERPDVCLDLVLELGLAISMPATNAPSARDRPAISVSHARPSVTRSRLRTNSSSLFLRTTSVSHQRMTTRPPTRSTRSSDRRLQRRDRELAQQHLRRRAEGGDQHQQRHDGEVLEQQHRHDAAAVLALELEAIGHQLDDDRRRAHRERGAERDRALPAEAPGAAARREERDQRGVAGERGEHRQHDLAQAEAEDELPHAAQLRQVELEADDEHQEDDAELGQVADAGGVAGDAITLGPRATPTPR